MIFDGIMYGERKYDANGETVIYYLYDENNNKYGFIYNGKYYYYQINLQGDVIGIYDENGQLVVQYAYDVWGKPLSVTGALASTIGQINPIRYRGYYYDNETGFYYVSSRYYDPEIGRWINADGYVATGQGILGNNMFAYCGNNPVNRADPSGMFWKEIGNFFKKVGTKIADFAKATFGSGRSAYATIAKTEVEYLPDSLPITAKSGTKTTQTISKYGNSSKPISAYGKYSIDNPIESSSAGIKINIDKFTLDISVGFDNIGISTSLSNGNTTGSFGLKANLSEQKVGFEESTAIKWGNTTETTYTNVSASWWAIVAAYISVTTGQPMSRPAPRPTPSPSYAYGN